MQEPRVMHLPVFEHRGHVAVGHPHEIAGGKFNANFSIHKNKPFGEKIYHSENAPPQDTLEAATAYIEAEAKRWLDANLK